MIRLTEVFGWLALVALACGVATPTAAQGDTPLSWDDLERRVEQEVAAGFSGVIVVIRDGERVVDGAYGFADREAKIPMRRDTIFGIGSVPIDFTQVAILMLAQQGKLSLDDPITKFFDDVPADKRGITVEHLRTGRSGLRDFHGKPADGNPDHAWIDRAEALRRIFAQELLFAPGSGREHSHSAWGVLAAIVEVVSGESYPEFVTRHVFTPLKMKDTGFYGEEMPRERMAVGYGMRSNGEINAPPYWGPTSWLVMGSGGQVSTAEDLIRFVHGLREGKLLEAEMRELLFATWRGELAGGSIFGYEVVLTTRPETMMLLMSNHNPEGGESRAVRFASGLVELVSAADRPPYSLGVGMEFDPDRGLFISAVMPGSAAERDGLSQGDRLIRANGRELGDDPMGVLEPLLRAGTVIEFEVIRSGETLMRRVKPDPR